MPGEKKGHDKDNECEEIYKVAEREAATRAWASNDKLVFDDRSAHSARLHNIAEDNLQE